MKTRSVIFLCQVDKVRQKGTIALITEEINKHLLIKFFSTSGLARFA